MFQSIEKQFVRSSRPLYAHLVTLLEAAIGRGELPSGSRLPPERTLAARLRISRTTVVSAYRELESRGLLRGYVGRGTFVCAAPEPTGAPFAWRGKIAAAALRSSDTTLRDTIRHSSDARLVSLAAGEPAIDCFPTAAFRTAIDRVLTRDAAAAWRHGPTEGQPALREAIAERFGLPAESVLVISGAQQGFDLLARCLIDPGDAVIVDRPGYLGAIQSFHAAGAKLIGWDIVKADTRRARGSAGPLPAEVDLHQPDVPEPDRLDDAGADTARAASAGRALSCADRRRRDLSRALFPRRAAAGAPRPRRAGHRHPPEQLFEGAGAWPAAWLAVGGAVDRRADGDHQAAARPAHSESGAVRDGRTDPRRQFRRAPGHAARRARETLRDDARGGAASLSTRLRCSSRGPPAACISGAVWPRTSAPARCSIARWLPASRSCPATRSTPILPATPSCGSAFRARTPRTSMMRCGGWPRRSRRPPAAPRPNAASCQ